MAAVLKILISLTAVLFFNQNAFSKKTNRLHSLFLRKKSSRNSRNGLKKNTAWRPTMQQRITGSNNQETENLVLAALYGGLGRGIASVENFDYANGLLRKITNAGGYGIPPGIYSYAFNPTTGLPYMCDPTKTPTGGVRQTTSTTVIPPAKTPPSNSIPPPTPRLSTHHADKAFDESTDDMTPNKVIPDGNSREQQYPVQPVEMGKDESSPQKEQKLSPINDMTASMSSSNTTGNDAKVEKSDDGDTSLPPGNSPIAQLKVPKNIDQDKDVMSPDTTTTGNDANNDLNADGNAPTPLGKNEESPNANIDMTLSVSPGETNGSYVNHDVDSNGQTPTPSGTHETASTHAHGNEMTSSLSLGGAKGSQDQKGHSQGGPMFSGAHLGGFQNTTRGSSVGNAIFAQRPKSDSEKNSPQATTTENKLSKDGVTPLIEDSYHTTKAAAKKQKRSNSLKKLIKGMKYLTVKRNTISIKLPDIPPCPDMKQYRWPWNCLDEKENTVKKECIERFNEMSRYAGYSNQLPFFYRR